VGEPIGRLRFVLSSCLPLRLTNRWPVPQEPYRQEPFLVDEDRIGGSAISVSGISVILFFVRTGRGQRFPRNRHVDQVNRPTGASGEGAFLAGTFSSAQSVPWP